MKDFDDFVEWYDEECAGELKSESDRIKAETDPDDALSVARAILRIGDARSRHRLRKYHEWLSSQL